MGGKKREGRHKGNDSRGFRTASTLQVSLRHNMCSFVMYPAWRKHSTGVPYAHTNLPLPCRAFPDVITSLHPQGRKTTHKNPFLASSYRSVVRKGCRQTGIRGTTNPFPFRRRGRSFPQMERGCIYPNFVARFRLAPGSLLSSSWNYLCSPRYAVWERDLWFFDLINMEGRERPIQWTANGCQPPESHWLLSHATGLEITLVPGI